MSGTRVQYIAAAVAALFATQTPSGMARAQEATASSATAAETAALDLRLKQLNVATAELTYRNSAAAIPDVDLPPAPELKEGAALGEESLLVARALDRASVLASARIATKLGERCSPAPGAPLPPACSNRSVFLYLGDERPSVVAAQLYAITKTKIDTAFTQADAAYATATGLPHRAAANGFESLNLESGNKDNAAALLSGLGTVGTVVGAAGSLLNLFSSTYVLGGQKITPGSGQFEASISEALLANQITVYSPSRAAILAIPADIQTDFTNWDNLSRTAAERALISRARAATYKNDESLAAAYERAAIANEQAVKAAVDLGAALTTTDGQGVSGFSRLLMARQLRDRLTEGARLLFVNLASATGSHYTQQNLWSAVWTIPVSVMAGVTVNYEMIAPETGQVLVSGQVPVHGGYMHVTDVEACINTGVCTAEARRAARNRRSSEP